MCSRAIEKIDHPLSECTKVSQKENKRRHDWTERHIHLEICGANGMHIKPTRISC